MHIYIIKDKSWIHASNILIQVYTLHIYFMGVFLIKDGRFFKKILFYSMSMKTSDYNVRLSQTFLMICER